MSGRVGNTLVLAVVAVVVVAGLAFYLRTAPRPGTEPSPSPTSSTTEMTGMPTDSAAPTESPSESPTLTPSSEPSASPPADSLGDFVASIAAALVADTDGDGNPEWAVSREGSTEKLGDLDDVTFAQLRHGSLVIGRPAEGASLVQFVSRDGSEIASFDVPTLSSNATALLTPDRRIAYVVDDSIIRVDLSSGERVTLFDGPPVFRGDTDLSPSGNTLASPACDQETCQVHLVIGDTVTTIDQFVLLGTSDEYLIGYESNSANAWLVYNIDDGTRTPLALPGITHAWDGYAMEDGRFVLTGTNDQDVWSLVIVDPATGAISTVLDSVTRGDTVVYEFLPSTRWAAIGPVQGLEPGSSVRVIALDTGKVVAEVQLGP
ncbi:MAG TPA: hypothetical protein VH741_00550 [Candidatus Limnocylindrales bacterium]